MESQPKKSVRKINKPGVPVHLKNWIERTVAHCDKLKGFMEWCRSEGKVMDVDSCLDQFLCLDVSEKEKFINDMYKGRETRDMHLKALGVSTEDHGKVTERVFRFQFRKRYQSGRKEERMDWEVIWWGITMSGTKEDQGRYKRWVTWTVSGHLDEFEKEEIKVMVIKDRFSPRRFGVEIGYLPDGRYENENGEESPVEFKSVANFNFLFKHCIQTNNYSGFMDSEEAFVVFFGIGVYRFKYNKKWFDEFWDYTVNA